MATSPKKPSLKKRVVIVKPTRVRTKRPTPKALVPLFAFGGYFKGAWFELRQVHWPNRKATWSLTGAVLLFTGFFVVLILLLDVLFKYLFELILK